ncbi:hypothetical protein AWQ22_16115 (plasmid) [Picosynechococcus sp. PCC 7117]|nr:hypothetical protein AWQ22_16115 [Picosynechococcus sp. PCC 7117]
MNSQEWFKVCTSVAIIVWGFSTAGAIAQENQVCHYDRCYLDGGSKVLCRVLVLGSLGIATSILRS